MARRKTRKQQQQRVKLYDAKVTPTHHVRLQRLRVVVEHTRAWYVVRIDPKRERKVRDGLEGAGFLTCSPAEVTLVEKRGVAVEQRARPMPGYLFVGLEPGQDLRGQLWNHHDRVMSDRWAERPFFAIMGPFKPPELQDFVDKMGPEPVAVLYAGEEPIGTFPAAAARILEGQRLDFTSVDDVAA